MTSFGPTVSIVVPTRDREDLLRACITSILGQAAQHRCEVIVVNDGGRDPRGSLPADPRLRVIDGTGRGPAAARNLGIAAASGDVVLFTDDDALPQEGWVDAAVDALSTSPEVVAAAGRVESRPYDLLYEHSVESDGIGNFVTCNVAYRRADLLAVGGFDERFPYPHCEDRDLGERMARRGTVVFRPDMRVVHPPRPIGVRASIRRARLIESEWRLHLKHPQTTPPRWTVRWGPWIRRTKSWQRALVDEGIVRGSSRRAARFGLIAGGQIAMSLLATIRARRLAIEAAAPRPVAEGRLRIAMVGADPQPGGGVPGCAWLVVRELSRIGFEIDLYTAVASGEVAAGLRGLPGMRVINVDTGWRWNRWYSSHGLSKFATGLAARAWGRRRLAGVLLQQHRYDPYDLIYQFSTIETFGLRRHLGELPPLVLHPSTHMAGELAGLERERHLVARCETRPKRVLVQVVLRLRARRQRSDIRRAAHVIGISQVFTDHLVADYGVDPERVTIVPYPIDTAVLRPHDAEGRSVRRILMVSRISVRKGIDVLIKVSDRLSDLAGEVQIDVIGAETLWSDYRGLLSELNPEVAAYVGFLPYDEVQKALADADVLIQPATFEPFGLTVGEALASGMPVVVTDEVGAAEGIAAGCCRAVRSGAVDEFEAALRETLRDLDARGAEIRALARSEAERCFDPSLVGLRIAEVLLAQAAIGRSRPSRAGS